MKSAPNGTFRRFFQHLFDRPYLLLPLPPLFWSGNFIVGRAVRASLPPIGFAFWRWLIASLLMLVCAWPYLRRDWPLLRRHWQIVGALSILGIALFNTLVYTGLRFTTAINGVLLQSIIPVGIIAMTYLLFHDTITVIQGVGVCCSLIGVAIIITQGDLKVLLTLSFNLGDLLIVIAVIGYAAYSALLRKRPPLHPLTFLCVTFFTGMLLLLPFYVWEHVTVQVMPLNWNTVLAVGYVAIFPSIIAYLCYNRGVELIGANRAGLFIHLMPVFGSLMAILFLGEAFRGFHVIGILFILSGIVLATKFARNQGHRVAA